MSVCVQTSVVRNTPVILDRADTNKFTLLWSFAKTLFPNMVMFTGTGNWDISIFWRNTIQSTTKGNFSKMVI
jgi:hypothetical protein